MTNYFSNNGSADMNEQILIEKLEKLNKRQNVTISRKELYNVEQRRAFELLEDRSIIFRTPEKLDELAEHDPKFFSVGIKRWGCNISCKKCNSSLVVGGQRSLLQISRIINDFKFEHRYHNKIRTRQKFDEKWSLHATEIAHSFANQTTQQTHDGDFNFVDIDATDGKAAIASGNFTTGRKYLIFTKSMIGNISASPTFEAQTLHGSTVFAESGLIMALNAIGSNEYVWHTVWTAVVSEGIILQYKTQDDGNAVTANNTLLIAIEISEDLTENTDWFFDEDGAIQALNNAWETGSESQAVVTFTPAEASTWLIMGYARITSGSLTVNGEARLTSTGNTAENLPLVSREAEINVGEEVLYFVTRSFDLTNQSNSFRIESREDSSSSYTRNYNAIFALNLDLFKDQGFTYTAAESTTVTETPSSLQSHTLTPSQTGNMFALGYCVGSDSALNGNLSATLKVDSILDPANQSATFFDTTDASNHQWQTMFTVSSETNASHTWDLFIGRIGSQTQVSDRIMTVFSMELLASGAVFIARTMSY